MKRLILASASPRRIEMMKELGIVFQAIPSTYSEQSPDFGQSPEDYVQQSALGKAENVKNKAEDHEIKGAGPDKRTFGPNSSSGAFIIGADTVVVHNERILGKPETMDHAAEYMQMLRGATHAVFTGLALVDTESQTVLIDYDKTLVTFRNITDREISSYLSMINPLDKAGAYAIQGAGALLVESITGCYYNVVGFPLAKLETMFLKAGTSLFDFIRKISSVQNK